jgi:arsenite methyltransferase
MARDQWAEWLTTRRYGGDPEMRRRFSADLARVRDNVLDHAELAGGETLLDVGCGEGLIGFGALERGAGHVIFSDISDELLGLCREAAAELGVAERCRFVHASADDLSAIDRETVDVVTTRSVLIYVAAKESAFREFSRVLRPGGRVSLFEPINRFAERADDTWSGYDLSAIPDISTKVRGVYVAIQPRDTDPMLDFDERDLIELAEHAGLFPVHLRLDVEVVPCDPQSWDGFLHRAGNPRIPTLAEAMSEALTPDEEERLVRHLRPLVEEGRGTWRMAVAYLWAERPASSAAPAAEREAEPRA